MGHKPLPGKLCNLGTVRLLTKRLILRRFYHKDAEAMFENWAKDRLVTEFLTWQPHPSVSVTRDVLRDWIGHYHEKDYYQWAICLKDNDEPIGSIGVVEQRPSVRMAHIGYCLSYAHQNNGYMSEALNRVITYLFEEVGMLRIEARHDPNNIASERVMEKCGLVKEGILRQADINNVGIVDACYHALLHEEYEAGKN